MKIPYTVVLLVWVALASGCMSRTPRLLPSDHGLTVQTALSAITPIMPDATETQFRYRDWNAVKVVNYEGASRRYPAPLKSARYADITNVVVETLIFLSPGNPFLDTSVLVELTNGCRQTLKTIPDGGDVLNILPPFWLFDPQRRIRKANRLADSFLFLRDLQQRPDNGGRGAAANPAPSGDK